MKVLWYKQLICYLFIAILFTSGACTQSNDSRSYFVCEPSSASERSKYEHPNDFITSDYCTNELLQRNHSQCIRNNSANRNIIRRTQNHLFISLDFVTESKLFYFEDYYLTKALSSISSKIIIIEYIHRQDGAK